MMQSVAIIQLGSRNPSPWNYNFTLSLNITLVSYLRANQYSQVFKGGYGTGSSAHDHENVLLTPIHLLLEGSGCGGDLVGQASQKWVNSNIWRWKSKTENEFLKRSSLSMRLFIVAFSIFQFLPV